MYGRVISGTSQITALASIYIILDQGIMIASYRDCILEKESSECVKRNEYFAFYEISCRVLEMLTSTLSLWWWQDETCGTQKEANLVNAALEWDSGNQSSLLCFMRAQITYYITF